MKEIAIWTMKAAAIWAALLVGSMAGSLLVTLPAAPGDGPLGAGQAFLLVNALYALVLAALAGDMAGPAWRRAIILFLVLYTTETLLSTIEGVAFGAYLHMPDGLLGSVALMNAVKSAVAAAVAAWLWRESRPEPPAPTGLAWKVPAIALLYVCCYFAAGYLIAWQSAAVRDYYANGVGIDNRIVALLQIGRGTIWAMLAWLLARSLNGSTLAKALLTGAAFAIFMDAPLLYPNAFMPWAVREVHFVEIGVSNFLFGLLAVLLLSWSLKHDQGESGALRRTA